MDVRLEQLFRTENDFEIKKGLLMAPHVIESHHIVINMYNHCIFVFIVGSDTQRTDHVLRIQSVKNADKIHEIVI